MVLPSSAMGSARTRLSLRWDSEGQGRHMPALGAAQDGSWGGQSRGEHFQQSALGRAFLLRVSWQFFHANKIVSAMGSSGLNDKESKARARVNAEAAQA